MKKILVAIIAFSMTSVLANHHEGHGHGHSDVKHMVTFGDFSDSGTSGTFDLSTSEEQSSAKTGSGTTSVDENNVALNYTYAINGSWQVGAHYRNKSAQASDDFNNAYGVDFYYNLDGMVLDTCFVGLHYTMANNADEDEKNTIGLEYGHRFSVGSWKGMHLAFSPSVSYAMSTTNLDAANKDDLEDTTLAWNFIKFDVLF